MPGSTRPAGPSCWARTSRATRWAQLCSPATAGYQSVGVGSPPDRVVSAVITAGVIHEPVMGDVDRALRGAGAWLNDVPIRVSGIGDLAGATLTHGTRKILRRRGRWDAFVRLVDATRSQRGFGDYMGYAWLAAGRVEIALGLNLKIWDLAAPKIVVEEAGGRLTDLDGDDSLTSGHALATNGRLHPAALETLAGD